MLLIKSVADIAVVLDIDALINLLGVCADVSFFVEVPMNAFRREVHALQRRVHVIGDDDSLFVFVDALCAEAVNLARELDNVTDAEPFQLNVIARMQLNRVVALRGVYRYTKCVILD